jgi:hypothetical protein
MDEVFVIGSVRKKSDAIIRLEIRGQYPDKLEDDIGNTVENWLNYRFYDFKVLFPGRTACEAHPYFIEFSLWRMLQKREIEERGKYLNCSIVLPKKFG